MWSVTKKTAIVIDYELIGLSAPAADLCYLLMALRLQSDIDDGALLRHYYKTLLSFGDKVTSEIYSFEQLW